MKKHKNINLIDFEWIRPYQRRGKKKLNASIRTKPKKKQQHELEQRM